MATKKTKAKGATAKKTPINFKKYAHRSLVLLVSISTLVLMSLGIKAISYLDVTPLKIDNYIVTSALVYQNAQVFGNVVDHYVGGSLLTIDLVELKYNLESLGWIYKVSIQKQGPGTLLINVEEHEPVANWNEDYVLNGNGEPLNKPFADLELTKLIGPDDKAHEVMKYYLEFSQVFDDLSESIYEVEMKSRGSWRLVLKNKLIVVLGDKEVLKRSRRVVDLLRSPDVDKSKLTYIDARYPNGVAIRYKQI